MNRTTRISIKTVRLLLMTALLLFVSCKDKTIRNPLAPSAVGTPWEVLVVLDKDYWDRPAGESIFAILDQDVPGLPQPEPRFVISRCDDDEFTGILKPVRNIIQIEISNKYSEPKLHYYQDQWASNQYVLKIVAPDEELFVFFVEKNAEMITTYFELAERERSLQYIRKTHNREFSEKVYQQFGFKVLVPGFMKLSKQADNFFWASNYQNKKRQDMVIYTYPYTDKNTFTPEYLNAKRDSVMRNNIPGGPEGSYMRTQKADPPVYTGINIKAKYAAEIRGLWEIKGDMMGGPYVSLTRLDEVNQRVVTVEVFVYAPEEDKRNLLRHNEAALYSLELPGEFEIETEEKK
ncbi:MAG: DUF4837 family protein [Bacteroidales bacterium]|nr:DUF4837 family protein [Bacteroidales bacterium]MDD3430698.1 DUF4837 family protein [Bacteroidales bacterium]MDD4361155.1 DUF4837 family protein [Bacteroidales bacterium]MDD4430169.1 DUF4837 family protein [Bacteroidales bacterium]